MAGARGIGAAAALAAVLLITAAPDAQAAHKDRACDAGESCFWKDANASGCIYDYDPFQRPGKGDDARDFTKARYVSCPGDSLNDSISSYRNNVEGLLIILYEHTNNAGATFCIYPGASGNVPPAFNDKASSMGGVPEGRGFHDVNCTYQDRD